MDVSRLDLRLGIDAAADPGRTVVTILIDGVDVLRGRFTTQDFIGFRAEQLLGPDSPLLPREPPRRVALYRCNCGEPYCAVVAPMIAEDGGVVSWYDLREFRLAFYEPLREEPLDVEDEAEGLELPITEIDFDSRQYRSEVERASAEWLASTSQQAAHGFTEPVA